MNVSLYQAAAAMNAHSRWQELIAENLAASSTPGFKKNNISISATESGKFVLPGGQKATYALPSATAVTSFTPGEIKASNGRTDVAIDGPGMFEIQLPDGSMAYTRDGEFQVNTQGQLMTKQGHLVMGQGGPIQLDPRNPAPPSISASGDVSQGTDNKGRIHIVEFPDPKVLETAGGGYFKPKDASLAPRDVAQPSVRQGFLEMANTSPVTEMASLITVMRSFEANQKVIQMQDDRMGKAISELTATS